MNAVTDFGLPCCVIGDQKAPRRIRNAIQEGHRAAAGWVDELGQRSTSLQAAFKVR